MTPRQIIEKYYHAWLISDREQARALLADDLVFHSPGAGFHNADEFLDACWKLSEGFTHMDVDHTLYGDDGGYVVYRTAGVCCGELIKVRDGKITEIYVTFDPTR